MSEIEIEQIIEIPVGAAIDSLAESLEFINKLRLALTKDARKMGNLYGPLAQRHPHPPTVQSNTQQRIF